MPMHPKTLPLHLLILLPIAAVGCSTIRSNVSPQLKTFASIGDRPEPVLSGPPGEAIAAERPLPERKVAPEGTISGRVVDARGKPVAGARVRLAADGSARGRLARSYTDDAGGFTLRGLRPGTSYSVIAEWEDEEGLIANQVRARAPDDDVRIRLVEATHDDPAEPRPSSTRMIGRSQHRESDTDLDPSDEPPLRINSADVDPPPPEAERLEMPAASSAPRVVRPGGSMTWRASGTTPTERAQPDLEPVEPREAPKQQARPAPARKPAMPRIGEPIDDDIADPLPPAIEPNARRSGPAPDFQEPAEPKAPARGARKSPRSIDPVPDVTASPAPIDPPVADAAPPAIVDLPPATAARPIESAPAADPRPFDPPVVASPAPAPTQEPEPAPALDPVPGPDPAPASTPATMPITNPEPSPAPTDAAAEPVGEFPAIPDLPVSSDEPATGPGDEVRPNEPMPEPALPPEEPTTFPVSTPADRGTRELQPPVEGPIDEAAAPARRKVTWGELSAKLKDTEGPARRATAAAPLALLDRARTGFRRTPSTTPAPAPVDPAVTEAAGICEFDAKSNRLVDFRLPDTSGREVRFQDFDADLILIDFWGSWCAPCRDSIPHLVKLQQTYGPKRLRVVGVAYEQESGPRKVAAISEVARKQGINYPLLIGPTTDAICPLRDALHVQVYPTMVLLDRHGRVLWRQEGATAQTLARLDRAVQVALQPPGQGDTVRR